VSLSLDATAAARISAGVRGVAWLVALDFGTGTIRYTTAPMAIVVGGDTYAGLGTLAQVSSVSESENANAEQLSLGFTVSTALLSATLGNVENYRGKRARLWLQLFDEAFQPAGAPVLRWSGVMDRVSVSRTRSSADGGPSSGRIELQCSRAGMARSRNPEGLRLSHAQQQQRFPGDNGLQYVQTLIEQPALWLSKRFQEV
jgi:hypothetical protein